jgi:glycosyltransferase involved in cell wall biosynthesis
MRVVFPADVYNISSFDPALPNPGIGGTTYITLVLASALAQTYNVSILTDSELRVPGLQIQPRRVLKDLSDRDVVVCSLNNYSEDIETSRARLVLWAHNTFDPKLDRAARRAERIVVLSGPQYDHLRWHIAAPKMQIIPHPFDASIYEYENEVEDYIVYLGALVPAKGFHHYARHMGAVLNGRRTKLLVIGGSLTYGREASGRLGVTTQEYEEEFWAHVAPFVAAKQVEFLGNLGLEKLSLIRRAKLALTNPTGSSETFCLSNLECMAMGTPVMGGFHKGMTATLYPDSRLTFLRTREIPGKINALLDNSPLLARFRPRVRAHAESKSDVPAVVAAWSEVFGRTAIPAYPLSQPHWIDMKVPIYLASILGIRGAFADLKPVIALRDWVKWKH